MSRRFNDLRRLRNEPTAGEVLSAFIAMLIGIVLVGAGAAFAALCLGH